MKKTLLLTSAILLLTFYISFGQYTKLLDFSGTSNGYFPFGSLISDGTFLYGMTHNGGTNSDGVIFKIKPDGTGYADLLDFAGTSNGEQPLGDIISDGTFLYGMTNGGGTSVNCPGGCGVIFKIKPDGTGYSKLLDFAGSANGAEPNGSLIFDGTFLYGMTYRGGINDSGVVFKIKPDGTGYLKLLDFTGSANGARPWHSLVYDGTFLYGMTEYGGLNYAGVIFKIKPDGTGYTKLLDFAGSSNGSTPFGSLISDGTFLYGMTILGGANNMGILFKIKSDGTGYTKLLDFAGSSNGENPFGSLVYDGTYLYAMTYNGGINNDGVVFKIKPDGTGYVKLLDFAGTSNGGKPYGSLMFDGTFLYGMTQQGGINNAGTIFKINPAGMGVEENVLANTISVFPNPSTGRFTIEGNSGIKEIEVINLLGEKVTQSVIPNAARNLIIDISSQPQGIYFMKVQTAEGNASRKLIVLK